jgi:hypothetical protein
MQLTDGRPLRILDLDIENRPLSYWVKDMPTAEITAIASCWVGEPESMQVDLLSVPCRHHGYGCPEMIDGEMSGPEMLSLFIDRYNEADMVTGHYIRMHDLPIINGALMEYGLPLLGPKLSCDTKLDMMKKADIPATQEFLLATLGVRDADGRLLQKLHMSQTDWREANRLTPEGIAKTKARVESDVRDHILLRKAMLEAGMLRRPSMWYPGGGPQAEIGRGETGG